jgi:hypothetical protein
MYRVKNDIKPMGRKLFQYFINSIAYLFLSVLVLCSAYITSQETGTSTKILLGIAK